MERSRPLPNWETATMTELTKPIRLEPASPTRQLNIFVHSFFTRFFLLYHHHPPCTMNNISPVGFCVCHRVKHDSDRIIQAILEQQSKTPQDLRNVVNFLRSSKSGIKVRVGALNGGRTDYFKGAYKPHRVFETITDTCCLFRQISRESVDVTCVRQSQKCTKSRIRRRRTEGPCIHNSFRILPPRRSWSAVRLLLKLPQTPPDQPYAALPVDRLLCVVLRELAMDDHCRWLRYARRHACWRYVPPLAPHHAIRRVVHQYRRPGAHRSLYHHCHLTANLLHYHCHRREPGHLDIPQALC